MLIIKIAFLVLLLSNTACSEPQEEKLLGSWFLICNYCEYQDIIIFRSDHKYFVYNPIAADIGSYELTGKLKDNDIRINGAYTSMTEKGTWHYDPSGKELILSERTVLESYDGSFSGLFEKSSKLSFHLKQLSNKEMELCFDKQGKQVCNSFNKDDYIPEDSSKTFYRELNEEFAGTGSLTKEVLLSGYETKLKLTYEFYKEADQLNVTDKSGKELFTTEMTTTNGRIKTETRLRGVTKLFLKVTSSEASSKWKIRVEIK